MVFRKMNAMRVRILFISLMLLVASVGHAATLKSDSRLKTIPYQAHRIVPVTAKMNLSTLIQLSPQEKILTIALGVPQAWQVEVPPQREHLLLLKPLTATTVSNMTVVTHERHYHFELKPLPANSQQPGLYELAFSYPAFDASMATPALAPAFKTAFPSGVPVHWNRSYAYQGDASLAPVEMFDDGKGRTYIRFKETSDLPALFAMNERGEESLLNFRLEGVYVVVERICKQMNLRAGHRVTSLLNEGAAV